MNIKFIARIVFCLALAMTTAYKYEFMHIAYSMIEYFSMPPERFFFSNMMQTALSFFYAVFFIASLYGLGRFLLVYVFKIREKPLETFIFSSALGYATLGGVFFIVAVLKIIYLPVVLTLLVFFIALGLLSTKEYKPNLPKIRKISQTLSWLPPFYRVLLALAFASVMLSFLSLANMETGYDALNYYLPVPEHWIIHHGITDMPSHIYFNLFGLYACIYYPAMVIGEENLPKIISFFAAIPGVMGLAWHFGRKYFGIKSSIMALAVICLTFQFNEFSFTARSDSMTIMFILASLASALKISRGNTSKSNKWLCLSAILAGAAMATKPTSILLIIPIMCILFYKLSSIDFYCEQKVANVKKASLQIVMFTVIASILVVPWLIINLIHRGNPFFPFLTGIFGFPNNYDAELISFFYDFTHQYKSESLLPLRNLYNIFFDISDENRYTSPMLLMLCCFTQLGKVVVKNIKNCEIHTNAICFIRILKKEHGMFFFFCFFSILLLLPLTSIARFYFPAYVIIVVLSTYYARKNIESRKIFKILFFCLLIIAWMPSLYFSAIKQDMVKNGLANYYKAIEYINNDLPENIYVLNDDFRTRSAYLHKPFFVTSLFDKYWYELFFSPDDSAEDILRILNEKGFTHIISNKKKAAMGFVADKIEAYHKKNEKPELEKNLRIFKARYLKEVFKSNIDGSDPITSVYEIDYSILKE